MPGQLRMERTHYEGIAPIEPPPGHGLRTYEPGDEEHWARIVNSVESLGRWDVDSTRRDLTGKPQFDPKGLFFATADDVPVATACAWRDTPGDTARGQLHMVAADPAHRGKGLGALVSRAVLRYFEAHGVREVYLFTDDFRLPAVKTYPHMGFQPLYPEADHHERWRRLYDVLGYAPKP